jgi:hypothetical protein
VDRDAGTDWAVPCDGEVTLVDVPGGLAVRSRFDITVDPSTVVFGGPLTDGVWDLQVKTEGMGYDLRRRPATERVPAVPAFVDGRPVVAYVTDAGTLAVDVGHRARTVVGAGRPNPADARVAVDGDEVTLTVALPVVHARGAASLAGELIVGDAVFPATLTANDRGVAVAGRMPATAASGAVVFRFLGRRSRPVLTLGPGPTVEPFAPPPESTPRRALRTLRRGLGRGAPSAEGPGSEHLIEGVAGVLASAARGLLTVIFSPNRAW